MVRVCIPSREAECLRAQRLTLICVLFTVAEHQRLNKLIDELTAIDACEEGKLTTLSSALRAGEIALQGVLDELKPQLHALHLANRHPVDVDDVISYGTKNWSLNCCTSRLGPISAARGPFAACTTGGNDESWEASRNGRRGTARGS